MASYSCHSHYAVVDWSILIPILCGRGPHSPYPPRSCCLWQNRLTAAPPSCCILPPTCAGSLTFGRISLHFIAQLFVRLELLGHYPADPQPGWCDSSACGCLLPTRLLVLVPVQPRARRTPGYHSRLVAGGVLRLFLCPYYTSWASSWTQHCLCCRQVGLLQRTTSLAGLLVVSGCH
jgi:hypothetical protein